MKPFDSASLSLRANGWGYISFYISDQNLSNDFFKKLAPTSVYASLFYLCKFLKKDGSYFVFTNYEGQAAMRLVRHSFMRRRKPWRSMVEATGIEPVSALPITLSATCLVSDYTHTKPQRHSILARGLFVILHRATKLLNLTREFHLDLYESAKLTDTFN